MLDEKKYLVGTGYGIRESAVAEMLARIYDFIWIDWEHTWLDRKDIFDGLVAVHSGGAPVVVRIPWNDPVLAKPILEMGPDGIVFPQIHSYEEAKAAIAACTYPPDGIRGWGPGRAVWYGDIPAEQYIAEQNERIFKILQVENMGCVRDLDKILELKGVDCICVGPMDLSASVGHLARLRDAEVQRVYDQVGEIARRHDVPLMLSYGFSPEEIADWRDRGVRIFHINGDMGLVKNAAMYEIKEVRRIISEKEE